MNVPLSSDSLEGSRKVAKTWPELSAEGIPYNDSSGESWPSPAPEIPWFMTLAAAVFKRNAYTHTPVPAVKPDQAKVGEGDLTCFPSVFRVAIKGILRGTKHKPFGATQSVFCCCLTSLDLNHWVGADSPLSLSHTHTSLLV